VPASRLEGFNAYVSKKLIEHGVVGEAHWTKIGNSHGVMNFAIELWPRWTPQIRPAMDSSKPATSGASETGDFYPAVTS
jgi:hypothetical protein